MSTELEAPGWPRHHWLVRPLTTVVLLGCWSALSSPLWAQDALTRVSVGPGRVQGDSSSYGAAISADGRFVAFYSYATNLVPGDTNGASDVFVHDGVTATTMRVSVASGGEQANGGSTRPALSADGRFVAFESDAANLVSGDDNAVPDIFVHDRQTGTTTRVSVGSAGEQANGGSWAAALSADGRFVAFESDGTNLVPGDDNAARDVFVHDRQTRTTARVSVGLAGAQADGSSYGPVLSANGRIVAFSSYATNLGAEADSNGLSDVFVRDRQAATTTRISGAWNSYDAWEPSISADGRFVAFSGTPIDEFSLGFVQVLDRETGTRTWIGWEGDTEGRAVWAPSISADGRFVACAYADAHYYMPWSYYREGILVHEIATEAETVVSIGTGSSPVATMTADGRFVAFQSEAEDLVEGDTNLSSDVFVRDGTAIGKWRPANGVSAQPLFGAHISPSWWIPWLPPGDAASYELCFDVIDNGACDSFWWDAADVWRLSFSAGTKYFWQVRSGTNYANGGTWWSFTTALPPGAFGKSGPANGATGQTTSLTLTWNPSAGATGYQYCFDLSNDDACYGDWRWSDGTSAAITVDLARTYYWQVRAFTAAGSVDADEGVWWSFSTVGAATRIIGVSGNLAFGNVAVNTTATRTLTISNAGNGPLTVTGITYPAGFSGAWSGTVAAGGSQTIAVTFAPTAATSYGGTVTVNGNQTSGVTTAAISGTGTPTDWVNVALRENGARAIASSFFSPHYSPDGAIDGDRRGANWGSGGGWNDATLEAYPDWVEVDFPVSQTIGRIDVFTVQDDWSSPVDPTQTTTAAAWGLRSFDVQYWNGNAWQPVPGGTVTGNTLAWRTFTFTALTTTKIRVFITNAASGYSRIAEVEAWAATPRVNVALGANGARAVASSTHSTSYLPSGAIDGDRKGVGWGSGGGWNDATPGAYPDWLEVELAGAQTIDEVDVFTVQNAWWQPVDPTSSVPAGSWGLTDFEVQFWDGSAWQAVPGGAVTGNTLAWRQFGFSPISTTKIRVYVTGAASSFSRIVEVEAWSPSPSLPPPTRANVALSVNGGTADGSSTYSSGYSAAGAIDGDRTGLGWQNTGGWNDATDGSFPDWLEVNFAGAQTITEVDVFTVQDDWWAPESPTPTLTATRWSLRDFEVQYWTGTAWQTVPGAIVTGNTLAWRQFTFEAIQTTKIRVWVTDAALYSRIVEVEAWNPRAVLPARPRANVALATNLARALASSTYSSSYPAGSAIDGDRLGTQWSAGGGWNDATGGTFPDWLEVDFVDSRTIGEIDVFTLQDGWHHSLDVSPALTATLWGLRAFEVQYWDGTAWQLVPGGTVTGNTFAWRRFIFEPITTGRIRVVVNDAPGYARIVEVEAWTR